MLVVLPRLVVMPVVAVLLVVWAVVVASVLGGSLWTCHCPPPRGQRKFRSHQVAEHTHMVKHSR